MALARGDRLLLIAVLAAAGTFVAMYLVWYYYNPSPWCTLSPGWDCKKVRDSIFSNVAGIPTATVGVAGFAIMLALAVLPFRGVGRIGPWTTDRWLLTFAALGALIGLGLTFVEIFVIGSICIMCLIGFLLDLGILGLAVRMPPEDSTAAASDDQSASRSE